MKYSPRKSIFQIRYDPKLSFYNRLYKNENLSAEFPHWQTDKLSITLRDWNEKKHSIRIAHESTSFESDYYNKQYEEEAISFITNEILNYVDDGTFQRFGFRRYYLIKQDMLFSELAQIMNLKCITQEFKTIFKNQADDLSITILSSINSNDFRLTLGPMKKEEMPKWIKYNIDNHISPEPNQRVKELGKIFEDYPEVAIFLDIDYFLSGKNLTLESLKNFWELSKIDIPKIIEDVVKNLIEKKIKK